MYNGILKIGDMVVTKWDDGVYTGIITEVEGDTDDDDNIIGIPTSYSFMKEDGILQFIQDQIVDVKFNVFDILRFNNSYC